MAATIKRKGLLTASLLLLTDSIAESKATKFWTVYEAIPDSPRTLVADVCEVINNNRSSLFQSTCRPGYEEPKAAPPAIVITPSLPPARLSPRNRIVRAITNNAGQQQQQQQQQQVQAQMLECCARDCPSCLDKEVSKTVSLQDIRGGHQTPYNIPLNVWKIIFQVFLTALNVACWLIPLRHDRISENKLGMSLANAFSGGVFLSLAFGHLIPECAHGFEGKNEALPFMIVLGGYLLIFFVEKVAFDAHGLMHEHVDTAIESSIIDGVTPVRKTNVEDDLSHAKGLNSGRSAVILLGALAVHSILEMTALGLADSFGDSALLSLSIALHQPAESIALLVAFLKSGMSKGQIIKYLSIFSAMGPIGVAIGMAVNEFAAPIMDSIMLATVAGTFIYVGATEVIPEEWEDQEHKWKKFAALISGIVSIFIITQYTMTLEEHTH